MHCFKIGGCAFVALQRGLLRMPVHVKSHFTVEAEPALAWLQHPDHGLLPTTPIDTIAKLPHMLTDQNRQDKAAGQNIAAVTNTAAQSY